MGSEVCHCFIFSNVFFWLFLLYTMYSITGFVFLLIYHRVEVSHERKTLDYACIGMLPLLPHSLVILSSFIQMTKPTTRAI